jgi:3-oxoacyl-[acyl-carrier protein] reductase
MDLKFDFSGKVVLVTGAAGGIGRQVAAGFAQSRARVLAVDLSPAIETLAPEYGAIGLVTDVSRPDQVGSMMDYCLEHLGPPDVLVNIAAISTPCLVKKMDLADWQHNLDVNLTSVYLCTTAALPHMIERKKGVVISFSSVVAEMGGKSSAHYAAAKAGVEAFSRSLAREVGPLGIRINVVAPGMVDTTMLDLMGPEQKQALAARLPLPRLGRPEDLVGPVLFLASEAAAYITGHILDVNGGLAMS